MYSFVRIRSISIRIVIIMTKIVTAIISQLLSLLTVNDKMIITTINMTSTVITIIRVDSKIIIVSIILLLLT